MNLEIFFHILLNTFHSLKNENIPLILSFYKNRLSYSNYFDIFYISIQFLKKLFKTADSVSIYIICNINHI